MIFIQTSFITIEKNNLFRETNDIYILARKYEMNSEWVNGLDLLITVNYRLFDTMPNIEENNFLVKFVPCSFKIKQDLFPNLAYHLFTKPIFK